MLQDIRIALRSLLRAPAHVLLLTASLSVGMAAPIAAFSALNVVFGRYPDVENGDALVGLSVRGERTASASTFDDFVALRDGLAHAVSLAAQIPSRFAVSADGRDPVTIDGELVSSNYFETVGVRPAAGRFFGGAEATPRRDPVVVIGFRTWQRLFASEPAAIGRTIVVNGRPLQIVGVAPERFHGVTGPENLIELWLPLGLADLALRRDGKAVSLEQAGPAYILYTGRLRPGASAEYVQAQAAAIVDGRPSAVGRRTVTAGTLSWLAMDWVRLAGLVVPIMALPLLVLVIACVNAGNLVLARSTRARALWTIQLALGASRRRLIRYAVAEGLLVAIPSAAVGILLAGWAFPAMRALMPLDLTIDWRVVVFAVFVGAGTPVAFSVVPVWSVLSRLDERRPGTVAAPPSRSRFRAALVAVQAALCVALLGTGTQFARTVRDGLGDGFGPGDRLLVASFDLDKLGVTREAADRFYTDLLEQVRLTPGGTAAAIVGGIDFTGGVPRNGQLALWLPGDSPADPRTSLVAYIAGDPFPITGLRLLSGRKFRPDEQRGTSRAAIVNERFARDWLGGNALGRTIRVASSASYAEGVDAVVVGVVSAPEGAPRNDSLQTVFLPAPLDHLPARTMYVPFADGDALAVAVPAIREAIRRVLPLAPYTMATLADARWQRAESSRFTALSVMALGALALVLAAAGLFGVVSYVVELRTREIGVRMALGATASAVFGAIVRESLVPAVAGAVTRIGLAATIAIVLRSRLYGAGWIDPVIFAGAVLLLLLSMLTASVLAAWRATHVDPAIARRADP